MVEVVGAEVVQVVGAEEVEVIGAEVVAERTAAPASW